MNRYLIPIITTAMLTMALVWPFINETIKVSADTNEGALSHRFTATGQFDIIAAGVGLDGGEPGDISLDVPGGVFRAYLYWSGYATSTSPSDFDSVSFSVDGEPSTIIESDWVNGPDPRHEIPDCYNYTYGADITSLVESGSRDYTISGEGLTFTEPHGAGLLVVYQDVSLPVSHIIINDGLDSFYCAYGPPQGPNSEATYFDFASNDEQLSADITMFIAGVTSPDPNHKEPELSVRPNAIWYQTGNTTKPDNLIDEDGIELDGGPPAPYPLGSSDGQRWDTYKNSVDIPAGDTWLGLQIESVADGEGTCCNGLFLAAGIVVPENGGYCTTTNSYSVCTDKDDYGAGETVHISGSGFASDTELTIKVTRPDGSVVTGDGSFVTWPTDYDMVSTDGDGSFQYDYILNGIQGEYLIQIMEGSWYNPSSAVLATHTFSDDTPDVSSNAGDFVIVGDTSVSIWRDSIVEPGSSQARVGSNGTLTLEQDSVLGTSPGNGHMQSVGDMSIKYRCEIYGDLAHNGTLTLQGEGGVWEPVIHGDVFPGMAPIIEMPDCEVIAPGGADATLGNYDTYTFTPGTDYGDFECGWGNTLTFPSGTYSFQSLEIGQDTVIQLEAPVEIHVANSMHFNHRVNHVLNAGTAEEVLWLLGDGATFTTDPGTDSPDNSILIGTYCGPTASVSIGQDYSLTGAIYADTVEIKFRFNCVSSTALACTTYYLDADGDTYGVDDDTRCLFAPDGNYTALRGGDCDDTDSAINPGASEICDDGEDNDCDGLIDCEDSDCPSCDDQDGWYDKGEPYPCCNMCCDDEAPQGVDQLCASSVSGFYQGKKKDGTDVSGSRSNPAEALGPSDGDFVSLGFGGELILAFDYCVGNSITIYEVTNGQYPLEEVQVLGSIDGVHWINLGMADNTQDMPAESIHPTTLDLGDICIKYVKIIDESDTSPHSDDADAFDVDAVCGEVCSSQCEVSEVCSCQDQEYRDYYCEEGACVFDVTREHTLVDQCTSCDDDDPCTLDYCVDGQCVHEDISCPAYAPGFTVCLDTELTDELFIQQGANCSGDCSLTLEYGAVDTSIPGIYAYTASCSGECGGIDIGFIGVVAPCEATAQDFTICQGTQVNDDLFISNGASCSQPSSGSLSLVSDTSTVIGYSSSGYATPGDTAELAWVHSNWWPGLSYDFGYPGNTARWIWESNRVQSPIKGDIVHFLKPFIISGTPTAGTINITCDNGYELYVNGTLVNSAQLGAGWETSNLTQSFVQTSGWQSVENYNILGYLVPGINVLEVRAANEYMGPDDGQANGNINSNPGGLIFEASIDYEGCQMTLDYDFDGSECGDFGYTVTCDNSICQSEPADATVTVCCTPVLPTLPAGGDLGCNPTPPSCVTDLIATSNCDGAIPVSCEAGPIIEEGCNRSQTFTYTATDSCDNTVSDTVTYTWKVDTEDPVLPTLPAGGDMGCNPTPPSCVTDLTATDNCDGTLPVVCEAGLVVEDGCNRSQVFTYSATDSCDNTASDTVTYTWKVDTEAPIINCPPDITIEEGESTDPADTGSATATDNCDAELLVEYTDDTEGSIITRTWTATDNCGNSSECIQIITVREPPRVVTGGIPCKECTMEIDMLGEISEIEIGCCSNETLHSYDPSDPDNLHFLLINSATDIVCGTTSECGNYPRIIVMREADDPAGAPENGIFVGPVYEFTGYEKRDWEDPDCPICGTVTFGQAVSALIGYDPDDLPEGVVNVGIYVFDPGIGKWVLTQPVPGIVAGVGQASGLVDHFSQLAVIAEVAEEPTPPDTVIPEPESIETTEPAHFNIKDLNIETSQVSVGVGKALFQFRKGEHVNIAADILNNGGQGGTYTATLKINGDVVGNREVALQPGQGQQVVFTVTGIDPGEYEVQIGDLSGKFEVVNWTNWPLIAGIAVGCGLLFWAIWYLNRRRRRGI